VTTKQEIAVSEWSESQSRVILEPQRRRRRLIPPGIIGVAGTLVLHGLVLQSALVVGHTHKILPPEVSKLGTSLNKLAGKPAERLVFIDLPRLAKADSDSDETPIFVKVSIKLTQSKVELDPPAPVDTLALEEEKEPESAADTGHGIDMARLYGAYSGQIQARVERVWSRPRTPVNEGSKPGKPTDAVEFFHCQVQIVQDSSRFVQEILLLNCNGSDAWRRSLVSAIQQASPLPAPPSPMELRRTVSLNFIGYQFVAGGSEEGYNSARIETAQVVFPAKSPEQIAHDFLPFHPAIKNGTSRGAARSEGQLSKD